jgi:hypothetical protein
MVTYAAFFSCQRTRETVEEENGNRGKESKAAGGETTSRAASQGNQFNKSTDVYSSVTVI